MWRILAIAIILVNYSIRSTVANSVQVGLFFFDLFKMVCTFCSNNHAKVRVWWPPEHHLHGINDYSEFFACLPCAFRVLIEEEHLEEEGVNWELICIRGSLILSFITFESFCRISTLFIFSN